MSRAGHLPGRIRPLAAAVAQLATALTFLSETSPVLGQGATAESTRLQPVTVTRDSRSVHDVESEFDRVGPAQQPEWTTRRAFGETDVYVIPPGEFEFNQFYSLIHPRSGKPEHSFESEFEVGLPWRTQLDVELNYEATGGRMTYDSTLVELPHALADWGRIPLNPTIDAGWRFKAGGADAYFFRLLLADDFGKRMHFGTSLSFENQIGGDQEKAYELNTALTWAAIDQRLSLGAELIVEYETEEEEDLEAPGGIERSHSTTVMLGPILLYRPTRNTHVGLMPRFGLTHDSPAVEAAVVFGIDLEPFLGRDSASDSESHRLFPRFRRR